MRAVVVVREGGGGQVIATEGCVCILKEFSNGVIFAITIVGESIMLLFAYN